MIVVFFRLVKSFIYNSSAFENFIKHEMKNWNLCFYPFNSEILDQKDWFSMKSELYNVGSF